MIQLWTYSVDKEKRKTNLTLGDFLSDPRDNLYVEKDLLSSL